MLETLENRRRGDREVLRLRLDEAIACYDDAEDRVRVARLALRLGRYRTLKLLGHPRDEKFLLERALPMISIGGDPVRGFAVDERTLAEIASELDRPLAPLLAETVRWMLAHGSRQVAKLYVLARLSGDAGLVALTEPAFSARARHPRRQLAEAVMRRFSVELLQAGDDDDYNPKSAWLFAGGDRVIKENLRLHLDPDRPSGYSQERELLSAIDHPRVVRLVDVASQQHHELLVLTRAEGETLDGRAHADARRIGAQLAETLAWLHAREILYLDVKPKNVIWNGREIVLCDFGMAQRGPRASSMLSTLEYVPPEMARELQATAASDVFQLGIVLHQLMTGKHPFAEGEGIEVALANLWDEPRLSAEPALIGRMLAKDPAQRPTAAEVAEALA
jgi:Protein kinase domain